MEARSLSEADVPGALLNGRKPEQLKIPKLKLWLACRKAPTKGKKADLVERCKWILICFYRSLKLQYFHTLLTMHIYVCFYYA